MYQETSGFNLYKDYIFYLLDKYRKSKGLPKEYHITKKNSISRLFERLNNRLQIEDKDYIYATMLFYKLIKTNYKLDYYNIEPKCIGIILLSHKFNDDLHHDNIDFARSSMLSLYEINYIEKELLNYLEFGIYIPKKTFFLIKKRVIEKLSKRSGMTKLYNKIISKNRELLL